MTTVEEIDGSPCWVNAVDAEGATASGISQANGPQSDGALESNGGHFAQVTPFTDGVRLWMARRQSRLNLSGSLTEEAHAPAFRLRG